MAIQQRFLSRNTYERLLQDEAAFTFHQVFGSYNTLFANFFKDIYFLRGFSFTVAAEIYCSFEKYP